MGCVAGRQRWMRSPAVERCPGCFKSKASHVISNDLEPYAQVLGQCYLATETRSRFERLRAAVASMNEIVDGSDSLAVSSSACTRPPTI